MRTATLIAAALWAAWTAGAAGQQAGDRMDGLVSRLAADYRHDPMAIDADFGIRVGERWWTVRVQRRETARPQGRITLHEHGPHDVRVTPGRPATPTWYFDVADSAVLGRLAEGRLSAATAAARSFGSDRPGLRAEAMEGFRLDAGAVARMYHVQTHFWTVGTPEVTYFEEELAREAHGAALVGLYGMKDKRIAWFRLPPEGVANEDPRLEAGPVPNLFIFTRGRGRATFADSSYEVRAGMSVFVGPGVRHVIGNPFDEPLEGILVLFGDNGDFYDGVSYPSFQDDLYRFYGEYDFDGGAEEKE